MTFQPVPNVAQTVIHASLRGIDVVNILNWSNPGMEPWTAPGVQLLAESVGASWAAQMLPVLGGNYTLTHVIATSLEAAVAPTFTWTAPASSDGEYTGETLPNNVALVVTHYSGFAGRSSRGRTYLCGLTEAQVNGNFLAATLGATILGAWNNFIEDQSDWDTQHVIVSRWLNGVQRAEGYGTFATSYSLRNERMDSQRRRLPAG